MDVPAVYEEIKKRMVAKNWMIKMLSNTLWGTLTATK